MPKQCSFGLQLAQEENTMDETDKAILNILRNNARISNRDLAAAVNLSPPAVFERVRKLKESKVIKSFHTLLDPIKLGYGLSVFIQLAIEKNVQDHDIGNALAKFPEITAIYDVAGDEDYLLKVTVKDSEALRHLMSRISQIPGVRYSRTTLLMRTLKEDTSPPVY